jgi:DNA-binding PadR family transcriptional regulator
MLELAILGLLKEQDLHGYELKKRLSETLGATSGVSFGSLYPALARLERAGAVRTVVAPSNAAERIGRPAIPLTGSLAGELAAWRARSVGSRSSETVAPADGSRAGGARAGRSRKVYGITGPGEQLFEELLAAEQTTGDDLRLFHLRLAFARYLSADARLGMLERRRAQLLDRLSRAASGSRTGRRIDSYVRTLMEHDREATEHDLSWIDRLIAKERGTAVATVASPPPASPPHPVLAGGPPEATRAFVVAERREQAAVATPLSLATPRPRVAPPTLSDLRAGTAATSGPPARSNQEESIR